MEAAHLWANATRGEHVLFMMGSGAHVLKLDVLNLTELLNCGVPGYYRTVPYKTCYFRVECICPKPAQCLPHHKPAARHAAPQSLAPLPAIIKVLSSGITRHALGCSGAQLCRCVLSRDMCQNCACSRVMADDSPIISHMQVTLQCYMPDLT